MHKRCLCIKWKACMHWLDDIHGMHACMRSINTCDFHMWGYATWMDEDWIGRVPDVWFVLWGCGHVSSQLAYDICMIHQFCKLDRYVEWHVGFTHGELRYGPHKDVWVTTVDFGFGKVGARDWCAAMEKSSSTFFLGGVVRAEKSNSSKIKPNTLKGTFGDLRYDLRM